MGFKLSHLQANLRTLEHTADDGDVLTLTYRPAAVTPAMTQRMRGLMESAESAGSQEQEMDAMLTLADMFAATVVAWNITDGDGNPVPCDRATCYDLGFDVIVQLWALIQADLQEGPGKEPATSAAGSRPKARSPRGTTARRKSTS